MKLRGSVGYGGENHAEDVAKVQLALSYLRRPSPKKFVPYWIWDIDGDFFDGAIGLALRFVEYDRKIRDTGLLTPASPVFRVISSAYNEATEDHRRIVETAFKDASLKNGGKPQQTLKDVVAFIVPKMHAELSSEQARRITKFNESANKNANKALINNPERKLFKMHAYTNWILLVSENKPLDIKNLPEFKAQFGGHTDYIPDPESGLSFRNDI